MESSPHLKRKYEQSDSHTRDLFDLLITESSKYCSDHTSVNMKEYHYRLQKKYEGGMGRKYQNYCLYTLTPSKKGISVHLRTEGRKITSKKIDIYYIGECSYLRGKGWVKFDVKNQPDIYEAIILIKKIYEDVLNHIDS